MPFGLINASATFQALMNLVFSPYLRNFVLVFFDDILVYSKSFDQHLDHRRTIFEVVQFNQLHVKKTKCTFAKNHVEYLRHIILGEGVSTDPNKIAAMVEWPRPTTVKYLCEFLGLTGYYRRFIQHYVLISKPLTELLKEDGFHLNSQAETTFIELKKVMTQAQFWLCRILQSLLFLKLMQVIKE